MLQSKQKAKVGNLKAPKKQALAKLQNKRTRDNFFDESDTDDLENYGRCHDGDEEESTAEREESRSVGSGVVNGDAEEDEDIVDHH